MRTIRAKRKPIDRSSINMQGRFIWERLGIPQSYSAISPAASHGSIWTEGHRSHIASMSDKGLTDSLLGDIPQSPHFARGANKVLAIWTEGKSENKLTIAVTVGE